MYYPPVVQTSAQLAALLSDETGTGLAVFGTSPTFVTPVLGTPSSGTLSSCSAATDSVAGVLSSADHTTLTSLSGQLTGVAPVFVAIGVPVIGWKSGVDLKTNGTTTIFTVPASRTFVCEEAMCVCTAVTAGAAVAFVYKIQESGASAAMTPATASTSVAPTAGKVWGQQTNAAGSPFVSCAAGNNVVLNITTGFTTSTTVTGQCFVIGYYSA